MADLRPRTDVDCVRSRPIALDLKLQPYRLFDAHARKSFRLQTVIETNFYMRTR